MNCGKFDYNLYFKMEESLGKFAWGDSPVDNFTMVKNKAIEFLGDGVTITDDELKLYIEVSLIPEGVKDALIKVGANEEFIPDEVTDPSDPNATIEFNDEGSSSESSESSENLQENSIFEAFGLEKPLSKQIIEAPKVNTIRSLYDEYFKGAPIAYSRFRTIFSKNVFAASFVSFNKKSPYIVHDNNDVNRNIHEYANSLIDDIKSYLKEQEIEVSDDDTVDTLTEKFKSLNLNTLNVFEAIQNDLDGSLSKAYMAFVAMNNFENLIKMQGMVANITVSKDDDGNTVFGRAVGHKMKNNFSDSLVNMIDEMSSLTKMMIEYTPMLNADGSIKHGYYLKTQQVTNLAGKLKKLSGDFASQSIALRTNPEERIGDLMRFILESDSKVEGLTKDELNVIRTVYNFYYKTGKESPSLLEKLNGDTVSLLSIKDNTIKNNGNGIEYNIINDVITTTIDKTISQTYLTLEEGVDGILRTVTQDRMINKYVNQIKQSLNSKSNEALDYSNTLTKNETLPAMKGSNNGFDVSYNGSSVKFKIPGLGESISINGMVTKSESIKELNMLKNNSLKIPSKLWKEYSEGNVSNFSEEQLIAANAVFMISKITGLNLYQNNGELFNMMSGTMQSKISRLLGIAAKVALFQKISKGFNDARLNNQDLSLKDYIKESKLSESYFDLIKGDKFIPFDELGDFTIYRELSNAMAIQKGDTSAAITRNLNGDGLPNTSLLNLIGDYRTIFEQHRKAKSEDMISDNLLVQNGNFNIITDVVFRSDIKDRNGDIKHAKKFNAAEIMNQAIFGDFWGNASSFEGKVMMEPTVFADKTGQAMLEMDFNKKINFRSEEFSVNNQSIWELMSMPSSMGLSSKAEDLHYHTMKAQYKKLHNKLLNDYKTIFKSMEKSVLTSFLNTVGKNNVDSLTFSDFDKILQSGWDIQLHAKNAGVDLQQETHFTKYDRQTRVNELLHKKFKEYSVIEGHPNYYVERMKREDKKLVRSYNTLNGNFVVLNDKGELTPEMKKNITFYLQKVLNVSDKDLAKQLDNFIKIWVNEDGSLKSAYALSKDGDPIELNNELSEEQVWDSDFNIMVNPLIQHMQVANRLTMGNFNLAMVGGPHAHKMKSSRKEILSAFEPKIKKDGVETDNPKFAKNPLNFVYTNLMKKYNNHDLVMDMIWEEVAESARTIAMHKRMVAYQAKLHPFAQGLDTGVIKNMKMLVVSDVGHLVWNTVGDSGEMDVADGSGWIPMVAAILMRNSIADMGTDSVSLKAIRHAIDGDTGTAHLDKYALQAMSNEVLRQSAISKMPWANLNKIALNSIKIASAFPGEVGNIFSEKYTVDGQNSKTEIIENIPPQDRKSKEFLEWVNNLEKPSYFKNKPILYSIDGTGILSELTGIGYDPIANKYIIKKKFKGPQGESGITTEEGYLPVPNSSSGEMYTEVELTSVYDIWQNVFGGMYSVGLNPHSNQLVLGDAHYSYNDDSNEALAHLMNNVVIKKNEDIVKALADKGIETESPTGSTLVNQANYYQPLKEAFIWQINNQSGMKNGAKNVNPSSILYDENPEVRYFITNSMHYGIQGNFDHKFSEEHEARVTEATQVISAAETNGYATKEVSRLYKSLATVISSSMSEEKKALLDGDNKISEMLMRTLVRIMSTKDRMGIGQAYGDMVSKELDKLQKENPSTFKYDLLTYKMAFSDSNFYSAMVSMVSGALNNSVIQRDLPGIAAVLSLAHDAIMIVDGLNGLQSADSLLRAETKRLVTQHLAELKVGNSMEFNKNLNQFKLNLTSGVYKGATETEIDPRSIDVYDHLMVKVNGVNVVFTITSPQMYYDITNGDYSKIEGISQVTGEKVKVNELLQENNTFLLFRLSGIPRNLKPSRLQFNANIEGVNLELNEMDLDAAKAIWLLKSFVKGEGNLDSAQAKLITEIANKKNIQFDANAEKGGMIPGQLNNLLKALRIEQQKLFADIQSGKGFTYNGSFVQGDYTVHSGELILPNYNKAKFGLKDGMSLESVTTEHFATLFAAYKDINYNAKGDFILNDKYGKHIYLIKPEDLKKIKGYDVSKNPLKKKFIDGVEYYVDGKGVNIFQALPNMEVININGVTYATYTNEDDINTLRSSEYFAGLSYNFKNTNNYKTIKSYINKYDIKSSKYIAGNKLDAIKLYDSEEEKDKRFNEFINSVNESWQKQLHLIGARIPAQSLQSFMAMKIVGFTDQDVNRAYVPVKKNWLDGSDFDIDKIYMMGFSIDRNGKFQTWTPYFDHNHFEKSLELPFPDGKRRTGKALDCSFNVNLINEYANNYVNGEPTTEESFSEMVEMLNYLQDKTIYNAKGLNINAVSYIDSFFQTKITDKKRLVEASKNAAMASLYKVSSDAANMMSGNRGVDMNDPKAGAKKSPKSWAAMQWSMDNYATLPSMKEENAAGKDVIGISAVGIKTFYALSHLYNQEVANLDELIKTKYQEDYNQGSPEEKEQIIRHIAYELNQICNPVSYYLKNEATGKTKKVVTTFLANINFYDKPLLNLAYDELLKQLHSQHTQNSGTHFTTGRPEVKFVEGEWTRALVAEDDRHIYLFGDNFEDAVNNYIPKSTLAVIRGLPNAIGISTKNNRNTGKNSYLTDEDYDKFVAHVDQQINEAIQLAKRTGKGIIIPNEGIGTGKANLSEKAPRLAEYLNHKLNELIGEYGKPINTANSNLIYNQEQKDAINKAVDFIENGNPNEFFLIEGKAGTGKTTIAELIARQFDDKRILVMALSHKATNVIKEKFQEANIENATYKTVAAGTSLKLDPLTKEFVDDPYAKVLPVASADIIFVDEASMINDKFLKLIMEKKKAGSKVVFLGDIGLLPPIVEGQEEVQAGGKKSSVFGAFPENTSKLVTRVRQGEEAPVLDYADIFWENSQSKNPIKNPESNSKFKLGEDIISNEGDLIFTNSFEDVSSQAISLFEKAVADKNSNLIKLVTYNNHRNNNPRSVKTYNTKIHNALFPDAKNDYSIGELIIFNEGNQGSFNYPEEGGVPTSSEGFITEKDGPYADLLGFDYYNLTVTVNGVEGVVIKTPTREGIDKFREKMKETWSDYLSVRRSGGDWRPILDKYWAYRNTFADIDYGYAITSHKSQGSTYDVVIVDETNINSVSATNNANKSESIYTALTRARNVVVSLTGRVRNDKKISVNIKDENEKINNFKKSKKSEVKQPKESVTELRAKTLTLDEIKEINDKYKRRQEKEEASQVTQKENLEYDDLEIIDSRNLDDYSLTLSALLSAATDNAKELILAKINAGPELAGTYVYMIIQGMSFDDITDFMVSPTVDAIVARSKSNVFTGNQSNITQAINYYKLGVDPRQFFTNYQMKSLINMFKTMKEDQKKQLLSLLTKEGLEILQKKKEHWKDPNTPEYYTIGRNLKGYLANLKPGKLDEFIEILDGELMGKNGKYKNKFYEEPSSFDPMDAFELPFDSHDTNINYPMKRFLKEVKRRNRDIEERVVDLNKVLEFERIFESSKEIKVFGKRLGINGGMGTSVYEHYNYNAGVSEYFYKKIRGFDKDVISSIFKVPNDQIDYKFLRSITDMNNFHRIPVNKEDELAHSEYLKKVISLYNLVKSKFNIIEAEVKLPHYKAMINAFETGIDMFSAAAVRYKKTNELMKKLEDDEYVGKGDGTKYRYNEDEVKKISNFILSDLVTAFFNSNDIEFNLPKGLYYYDKNMKYQVATDTVKLNLNTRWGRASFKLYMDNNKSNFHKLDSVLEGNAFLRGLVSDSKPDPVTGRLVNYIKLDLNMQDIKTEFDEIQFQEFANGFYQLKGIRTLLLPGKTVADMFFLYNLIVNQNAFGKNSFTKIFESSVNPGEVNPITLFMQYIGTVDASENSKLGSIYPETNLDLLALFIAKVERDPEKIFGYKGKYLKRWNKDLGKYEFYSYFKDVNDAGNTTTGYRLHPVMEYPNISSSTSLQDASLDQLSRNRVMENFEKIEAFTILKDGYKSGDIKIIINC